jgi:hypothetical protein
VENAVGFIGRRVRSQLPGSLHERFSAWERGTRAGFPGCARWVPTPHVLLPLLPRGARGGKCGNQPGRGTGGRTAGLRSPTTIGGGWGHCSGPRVLRYLVGLSGSCRGLQPRDPSVSKSSSAACPHRGLQWARPRGLTLRGLGSCGSRGPPRRGRGRQAGAGAGAQRPSRTGFPLSESQAHTQSPGSGVARGLSLPGWVRTQLDWARRAAGGGGRREGGSGPTRGRAEGGGEDWAEPVLRGPRSSDQKRRSSSCRPSQHRDAATAA